MATPNNLPAELTSFVGREPQLAELRRLLHRSRLITLTGPGGAGKTKLAVRLASESLEKYPDGVWLLDLAPIGEAALLEQTLAAVCGVKEERQRALREVIAAVFAPSRALIVFDGCDHLVDACADLTQHLLRSCPKLNILVTSRELLGVQGEVVWRTPSLTLPRPQDAGHPELLLESEAIRLFVDRARLIRHDFQLQTQNAAALAQICTRLEGIPLAIELAAGLAGVMTLQEILDRLGHRFRLLTGGGRSSLPRHQTLRQAVDWSYGLLSPTEQALFVRLSVFAGGFDLAAAEVVVSSASIEVNDVLPLLSRLVYKSLVVAEPSRSDVTRYRMLDTIREYALEKLQQSGEAESRRRHADYFTDWMVDASKMINAQDQLAWLRRMDEEQANIRLAISWSLAEQPENALRLTATMGSYWFLRRSLAEGYEWLGRALEVETSRRDLRALTLMARARLGRRRGDYATARRDAEECAAIARELGMKREQAFAETMLGIVTSHEGDLAKGLKYFMAAGKLAHELGDGERIASSLNNIALVESALGDHDAALAHVEQSAAVAESIGNRFLKATILDTGGRIHFRRGELDVALMTWSDALRISVELEDSLNVADSLEGMALMAISKGDAIRAIVLVAAADAIRTATVSERTPEWAAEVDAGLMRALTKLNQAGAESARLQGARMSMPEAVRFALGVLSSDRPDGPVRLSDREVQVARLIAEGLTNGEVAGRLGISERTVDAHLEHIRNKLGLRTRAQIAVWAHERVGTA